MKEGCQTKCRMEKCRRDMENQVGMGRNERLVSGSDLTRMWGSTVYAVVCVVCMALKELMRQGKV